MGDNNSRNHAEKLLIMVVRKRRRRSQNCKKPVLGWMTKKQPKSQKKTVGPDRSVQGDTLAKLQKPVVRVDSETTAEITEKSYVDHMVFDSRCNS